MCWKIKRKWNRDDERMEDEKKIDEALNESESQWDKIMMAEKNDASNEMQLKEIL